MTQRIAIGVIWTMGALALGACASETREANLSHARASTTRSAPATSGGTSFVSYDDGYRDGYNDALVAAALANDGRSASDAAAIRERARLRAEEADVARPGGPIPVDPEDPIVPASHHPR